MTWNAVAYAGAAIGSALISSDASRSASKKQKKWRQRAVDLQERMYDEGREDQRPYRELGYNAIANLEDPGAYTKAPGYQFRLDEGNRARENLWSMKQGGGNAMKALTEYNSKFASDDYYTYRNDQRANAGLGQVATNATGMMGMNYANRAGGQYAGIGDNSAGIGLWNASNMNNALQGGISNLLYSNKSSGVPDFTGQSVSGGGYQWPPDARTY